MRDWLKYPARGSTGWLTGYNHIHTLRVKQHHGSGQQEEEVTFSDGRRTQWGERDVNNTPLRWRGKSKRIRHSDRVSYEVKEDHVEQSFLKTVKTSISGSWAVDSLLCEAKITLGQINNRRTPRVSVSHGVCCIVKKENTWWIGTEMCLGWKQSIYFVTGKSHFALNVETFVRTAG